MTDSRRIIARLAVAVMAADGKISRSELETVARLRGLGLGDLSPYVRDELARAADTPIDPDATAAELGPLGPDVGGVVVAALSEIATVDGELAPTELRVLQVIGRRLGLQDEDVEHLARNSLAASGAPAEAPPSPEPGGAPEPRTDSTEAFEPPPVPRRAPEDARSAAARVLGVRPEASRQDVEAAYRRAVELYDPLRVVDLGPEFAVLAVRRLQVATDAFQILLAEG